MTSEVEMLPIAGFPVLRTTAGALSQRLLEALERGEQAVMFFANTNFIVQCTPLRERIVAAPNVVIANDGIGLDIGAWLVHRRRFVENLNGTDFIPALLAQAKRRVFLVGARPGVAARAADALRGLPGLTVAGSCDGFEGMSDPHRLVAQINASGAEVVLVALGNPGQERWILDHADRLDAKLLIGVGALFDFLAGDKPRAPALVRRLHLEWLYRLGLEPKRLARRYTVDIARFLLLCVVDGRKSAASSANA
ncbi:MAG: WecB/TagA/CpsF family glycosyltransferase [Aromatoleum sp.]|jgi:beta-1,4-glucosyltransferase|uniref:WecB/TagA/CpsF family glycosyltransferase n=1 Tax=Aromatoleum sp. TaxID=2307007 RepID=UPI002895FBDB|nr:WecB/TagA/CpsF family glycosyltransferase [Aromatoleum sp.]MDT3670964.1 WecB/TagA/CpsF family glycosyltransferase [Aromatoleum sp.]